MEEENAEVEKGERGGRRMEGMGSDGRGGGVGEVRGWKGEGGGIHGLGKGEWENSEFLAAVLVNTVELFDDTVGILCLPLGDLLCNE
ncbi:hypothetical protein Pmani_019671 [Petrolisthes manimaculis]|uniref:Uncharacterized protein n=1 Tax=Petrolisthes manimaculis TaxID=1843537 RepID=A0AAE1PJX5_9EUCA|nr:hypothetical protein Pmani_019671 [Petrolisthes manimaculis]